MTPIPQLNRVPLATYRLQFNRHFTFSQAGEIISYLAVIAHNSRPPESFFEDDTDEIHDELDMRFR